MSRGNLPVVVRLEEGLRERVLVEVAKTNRRRPKLEYSLSQFIREAIVEKLGHKERSAKSRNRGKYVCNCCKQEITLSEVSYCISLLTGGTEYFCKTCDLQAIAAHLPPN